MNKAILVLLVLIMGAACPSLSKAGCIPVDKAQTILKKLNYYPDTIDGDLGPATMKSIRTFQADYDLEATGNLDEATCAALQVEEEKINKEHERKKYVAMVRKVQKKLTELTYYEGPISGKKGDIPQAVLLEFQKDNQIEETGRLDRQTLRMVFSDQAKKKKGEEPLPGPEPKPTPTIKKSAPSASVIPPTKPHWTFSMGAMTYQPKSMYDDSDYEALNTTLNPEQAVDYKRESFVISRLTLSLARSQYYLATSRLAGGDNHADFLGAQWMFDIKDKPYLLDLDFGNVESDAFYDNRIDTLTTRSFNGEFLRRAKPGLDWGLSISHETYPTLVSCKNKTTGQRSIRFDKDFQLNTLNMALRYNSLEARQTGLFSSKHLFPYLTAGLYGGLAYGSVSSGIIDALSTDLNHSFAQSIYRINMKVIPEAGLKYLLHRPTFDMELTLGYGLSVHWPVWALPLMKSDDEVNFYRRNLSHGLVFGANIIF